MTKKIIIVSLLLLNTFATKSDFQAQLAAFAKEFNEQIDAQEQKKELHLIEKKGYVTEEPTKVPAKTKKSSSKKAETQRTKPKKTMETKKSPESESLRIR